MTRLLTGNEAAAFGAIAAGVEVVTGYPGTPSTEVLETIAKNRPEHTYVEWSVNEKSALEVAAGAAYCGARVLVTMKQVGLNVAGDPLMSLAYIGLNGGAMVILVADDPGPISSQTEQDTRRYAAFAHVPVFDPSSPEEAYCMIGEAFSCSERHSCPVFFRPTTRVCHGAATVDVPELPAREPRALHFEKNSRWVVFPRTSYLNHIRLERLALELSDEFSADPRNFITGEADVCGSKADVCGGKADVCGSEADVCGAPKLGIAASGAAYAYLTEALASRSDIRVLRVGNAYPFPTALAERFLSGLDRVLCAEELDPVVEDALIHIVGVKRLPVEIVGKRTGDMPYAGEYSAELVARAVEKLCAAPGESDCGCSDGAPGGEKLVHTDAPALPTRPPVLCAGCPHRASFYAVKRAMKGRKAVFTGDIGCYTLGNAAPLHMTDTCLCMGAGFTVAEGIKRAEPDAVCFAFIGDSTFFHTGIPGVVDAVYNGTAVTFVVLDNSTTAMTGHQPHPGTGLTMMGDRAAFVPDIAEVLRALGVKRVETANPFDQDAAVAAAKSCADANGRGEVAAIVFRAPCIALFKSASRCSIDEKCVKCLKCVKELGCPALSYDGARVSIDRSLCNGCGLCAGICPTGAISAKEESK